MALTFVEEQGRRTVAIHGLRKLIATPGTTYSRDQLFADCSNREAKKRDWQAKFLHRLVEDSVLTRIGPVKGPWVRYSVEEQHVETLTILIERPDELTAYLWPHMAAGNGPPEELFDNDGSEQEQTMGEAALRIEQPQDEEESSNFVMIPAGFLKQLTDNILYMRGKIEHMERAQQELLDMWKPKAS